MHLQQHLEAIASPPCIDESGRLDHDAFRALNAHEQPLCAFHTEHFAALSVH